MKDDFNTAPYCYHCGAEMEKLNAPSINLKNDLDWDGEFLWICVNDQCPVFVNGFTKNSTLTDEIHLFRPVVDPESGSCALAPVSPFTSRDIGALLKGAGLNDTITASKEPRRNVPSEEWSYFPTCTN